MPVESKQQKDIIWMIWECLLLESKNRNKGIHKIIRALLNLFCFKENVCKVKHCFTIHIPQKFMNNILKLKGLMRGNKVEQESKLPSFVFDCPKSILREFLGGMFGGDGHTCYLGLHRGKRDLLTSISFSQTKSYQHQESLQEMMENEYGVNQ